MLLSALLLSTLCFASSVSAAFGFTKSGSNYVIDAGSSEPLIFTVSGTSCDITSIKYRNVELQGRSKGSHISSGLGTATVSATQVNGKYVKVTCATSTLTHYLVAKSGDSTIYMATYITAEPSIGELRFIARLQSSRLPNEYPYGAVSTTAGSSSTVEGSDVFLVNGQTRSKFYSSTRFIDKDAQCVYGGSDEIHVCMLTPQPESSSGGPFFRDIETNNGGDDTNLYWYMNSGHVKTEEWRTNNILHGPYMMVFSRSGVPSIKNVDISFFSELDVKGFVPNSSRGYVSGTVSGVPSNLQAVVHWYNSAAQYWTIASSNGAFKSPAMKAGSYTMVLYQGEYKVATTTGVSVSAGGTTSKNIASTMTSRNSLWKIGEYDGQPTGFLNADKFLRMHPSDSRMTSWKPVTYTVGSSSVEQFPMALFQNVNNPVTIKFNLASAPGAATLCIATTLSFSGSRPQAKVNSWTGPSPAAPTKIDSRGVTRGAYRGYGEVYDVNIPSGTLVTGSNTITISSISGSSSTSPFLNPNLIFDCVELFT
ncbi:polysaccharide lyase family 4 protein [Xylaria bambusicola]|uniref:polysaccharide lyase family 4 protein n=1 Tax=Xylaria bambusicola TaxID=326684 RepID=UPI0020080718|nr:polysaccharide lyase family 4 protein [Xylaria bambusicola]KAI0517919.1 polysaccharide lyase family 4 protein [Xylaria bambusicola]